MEHKLKQMVALYTCHQTSNGKIPGIIAGIFPLLILPAQTTFAWQFYENQ